MKKLGLLGHPVSHSMSPKIFTDKFSKAGRIDLEYITYDLPQISDFLTFTSNNPDIVALNVTIPHKESILPFISEIDEEAKAIGAVNTLFKSEGKWVGYNTDGWGFRRSMQPFLKGRHERALIFGTGGSAKAVAYSLKLLGVDYYLVSRSPEKHQDISNVIGFNDLTPEAIKHHLLLINCTPLGMYPDTAECVKIPWEGVGKSHLIVDLVYNPDVTTFMVRALEKGAEVMNGRDMLRLQAEKSWDIWLNNGL
jgi:shikimate dehydrogenase